MPYVIPSYKKTLKTAIINLGGGNTDGRSGGGNIFLDE